MEALQRAIGVLMRTIDVLRGEYEGATKDLMCFRGYGVAIECFGCATEGYGGATEGYWGYNEEYRGAQMAMKVL
jgi:hypothetical protein